MARNIVFDLDGTLLDSRRRLHRLFCELAGTQALGFEDYWRLKRAGASQKQLLVAHLGFDPAQADSFKLRWLEQIEAPERLREDSPFPQAGALLAALAADNRLFIVTGRQDAARAAGQVRSFGWEPLITSVLATGLAKSKADLIRGAMTPAPGDLVVGDGGEELDAGQELGLRTIGVTYGFNDRNRLQAHHPERMVDDFEALAAAIGSP